MIAFYLSFGFVALVAYTFYYLFVVHPAKIRLRRDKIASRPFPSEWEFILQHSVPIYRRLSEDLQNELRRHIQIFLEEKHFEGCAGLAITETMRVSIAAQACILILNRNTDYYPTLKSILVYPETFVVHQPLDEQGLIPLDDRSFRLGESWKQGMVVLAWDHVKQGTRHVHDGQNLVFHEFAHQLDSENGAVDGIPILDHPSRYKNWKHIFTKEFQQLQNAVIHHRSTVLDPYGATNPAEFFAVATETFFEKPHLLRTKHPALYEELRTFYKIDSCTLQRIHSSA